MMDAAEIDKDTITAIAALVGQTGATGMEYGHTDDDETKPTWYITAQYKGGQRITVDGCNDPMQAAERMAVKLICGGRCRLCTKIISIGDYPVPYGKGRNARGVEFDTSPEQIEREGLCAWERKGERWVSGCGDPAPEGSTREKLAQAMIGIKVVAAGQIAAARAGRYDDYLAETAAPQHLLVEELRQYGEAAQPLIDATIAGEFDGTQEEADAWAKSADGRAAFAELVGKPGMGKFIPREARPRPDKAQRVVDPEAHRARMAAQKKRRGRKGQ